MKLYDMQIAPNPRRVRMFLAEKHAQIPTVQVDLMGGEHLSPAFKKINSRSVVPVLELDDGTFVDESVAICRYLESIYPEPNMLGRDAREQALIESAQRHMEFDGFQPLLDCFRNTFPAFADRGVPGQPGGFKAIPELAERGRRRYEIFLDGLNELLAEHEFIAAERLTIADITAFCALDFAPRGADMHIPAAHTHTRRWYDAMKARPSATA